MMNEKSRTSNSIRNAILSVICQIINILTSFLVRTIFIHQLSEAYLGIQGLFTNILGILSIADLGFDSAIIFSLYKPISEKDNQKISAIMNFFKKVYNFVGLFVLIIGCCFIPFLNYIVNLESDIGNIKIYYFIYLLNTSLTYFLANRVAIINADQKMYIVKIISFISSILQAVFQIIVLVVFKNFMLYLIIQLICMFLKNVIGAVVAKKMYPFLNNKDELSKKEKKDIVNNTKSFMVYKIGGVILNDTDNILISTLILTEIVGIYSNYTIIISAFTTLIGLIFSSALASVGNLNVNENSEKKEKVFYRINFLSVITYGVCSICLLVMLNDFISVMWGKQYVMPFFIPLAVIVNFLICGLLHPFRLYRETTSSFKEIKYVYILTSVLNLVLSFILAKLFNSNELKLFGIIIATAISRLLTNYWMEPKKIFNSVFQKSYYDFFKNNIIDLRNIFIIAVFIVLFMKNIHVTGWGTLIIKGIICFTLVLLSFGLIYCRTGEFKFYKAMFIKICSNFKGWLQKTFKKCKI